MLNYQRVPLWPVLRSQQYYCVLGATVFRGKKVSKGLWGMTEG